MSRSIGATTLAGTSAALSGRWAWTITAVARLIAALVPTTVTRALMESAFIQMENAQSKIRQQQAAINGMIAQQGSS